MIIDWLNNNQLATGALVGVVSNFFLGKALPYLLSWLREAEVYFSTTITVNNNNYNYYMTYAEKFFKDSIKKRNYILSKDYKDGSAIGYGRYFLFYKRCPVIIYKTKVSQQNNHYDELTIKTWFYKSLLIDINSFIRKELNKREEIYILNSNNTYYRDRDINRKLITKQQTELFQEIKKFFDNPTSKKSFLLSGNPGNGKSKCILNIAHILNKNIHVISIGKTTIASDLLNQILIAKNAIVILEDIDRIPISKDDDSSDYLINKGDLLNALDGIVEVDNCVIVATTNHKEKLDPALIRKGRFDNHIEFTNPDKEDLENIRKEYDLPDEFVDKHLGKTLAEIMFEVKNIQVS